jgi:hypothetical protein
MLVAQSLTENVNALQSNSATDLASAVNGSVGNTADSAVPVAVSSRTAGLSGTEGVTRSEDHLNLRESGREMPRAESHAAVLENGREHLRINAGFQKGAVSYNRNLHATRLKTLHAGHIEEPEQAASTGPPAQYRTDFPDSTMGTAFVSPPDPGTASSLEWSPNLNFGFPDFGQTEFLHPTLHIGGTRNRVRRAAIGKNLAGIATSGQQLTYSLSSELPSQSPEPGQLPASIDQQVGLQ